MLRKWGSLVVAAMFLMSASSAAFAGTEAQPQGALAPGAAAGVQQAQVMGSNTLLLLLGLGVVGGGIALAASGSGNGTPATTTTATP